MKIKHNTLFTTIALLLTTILSSAQRDTIGLNANWQFVIDKGSKGIKEKWYEGALPSTRTINLPHTWNIEEENQNHYGWGWYQQRMQIPANWKHKNVVLQFGAINHTSFIYVNGKKVAEKMRENCGKIAEITGNRGKCGQIADISPTPLLPSASPTHLLDRLVQLGLSKPLPLEQRLPKPGVLRQRQHQVLNAHKGVPHLRFQLHGAPHDGLEVAAQDLFWVGGFF